MFMFMLLLVLAFVGGLIVGVALSITAAHHHYSLAPLADVVASSSRRLSKSSTVTCACTAYNRFSCSDNTRGSCMTGQHCLASEKFDKGESRAACRAVRSSPNEEATHAFKAAARGCELHKCGTDKIWRHAYHVSYGPLLAPYLLQPNISILEIGVQDGLSLGLWHRLFPHHGNIAAIGYGQGSAVRRNGFKSIVNQGGHALTMYAGDQGDPTFLRAVDADLAGHRFDVIVDDGSHVPVRDQRL